MLRSLYLILIYAFAVNVYAQNGNEPLSGTVLDERKNPLEAVVICAASSKKTVYSDSRGMFGIDARPDDVLTFMLVGYEKTELKLKGQKNITVCLKHSSSTFLMEVLVMGYSSIERRDLTGSVSSVKPAENKPFHSIDQLLQGQATGVFMSNSSGALGSANLLTIRGINSITGNNNPLYVVDGVPVYSTDRSANNLSTTGGSIAAISLSGMRTGGGSLKYNYDLNDHFEKNPLLSINPEDIESVEILKDAYATAIYGSRGAAGVILITTKKGRRDRTQIDLSYSLSIDRPVGKLSLLNGDNYSAVYSRYYPNDRFNAWKNTDWIDEVTRTAVSHNFSASISGSTDKTDYFASALYGKSESYIINNDLSRYSIRINTDTRIREHWTLGANFSVGRIDNHALAAPQIYAAAVRKAPNLPVYDDDGNYYYGYAPNSKGNPDSYNPVAMAYINDQFTESTNVTGNIFLEYKPKQWLTFKSEAGLDIDNTRTYVKKGKLPPEISGVPNNQAEESPRFNHRTVINNTVNISRMLGNVHFIQGVVGQIYEFAKEYGNTIYGSDFFSPYLTGIGSAENKRVGASGTDRWALFSVFARLNYQWKRRYMAGFTYRLDGSSRYNRDNRYLNIPSASLGWRLSEENFIKKRLPWISNLKLRGSVGWLSQDANSGYYGARAVYTLSTVSYGSYSYLKMSQPGNENLRWEKTITYDGGMDLSLFDGKIDLVLDYYYKKTTDMLFPSDLPGYTGYAKQTQNIADMFNAGIELRIVSTNVYTPDFSWQTTLNLTRNTNKILKLNFTGNQLDQANSTYKYYAVGYPVAQWYLHEWVGVDPLTGNPLWRYADGSISDIPPAANNITSTLNKKVFGTATPTVYGGFSNSFIYKGFELSFLFSFAAGSKMINSTQANLLTYATSEAYNLSADILNFWQIEGQQTNIPKLNNKSVVNNYDYTSAITTTRYLEDNSWLRLKTLELSYPLSRALMKKIRLISVLKIFVLATNVWTLSSYSGLDPEVSAFGSSAIDAGYDNLTMPQSRSLQFGIRISL